MLRRLGNYAAPLLGTLLTAASGVALLQFQVGDTLERLSYNLLLVSRGDVPVDGAVVVYLDEISHQKLGQPLNAPFDRRLHAKLTDRLTAAGARAIVFDIVFSDPDATDPARDEALAQAIKASGKVVLAADNIPTGPKSKTAIPPFPLLLDTGAAIGSAEVMADVDMVVREHTPEDQLPSLSWAAAELVGAEAIKTAKMGSRTHWVNYYGPPNSVPWTSYADALDPATIPDSFFSNKVVFVGARIMTKFAGQRKDEYSNPFSLHLTDEMVQAQGRLFIAGVEIQATAFLNLLRGDWLRRLSLPQEEFVLALFGLVLGLVLTQRFHPLTSMSIGAGAAVAVVGGAVLAFRTQQTWFPWLIALAQIGVGLTWSVTYNAVRLYVQKRLYEYTLGLYLSPKLVKKFASSPQMLKPGAEKQMLTLLFSDIADFTNLSEGMDSDELAKMMNDYFQSAVSLCIHRTDGTVVKYIGDAIFAFWNAPELQPDHAFRACCAALHFKSQDKRTSKGHELRTRIGLHTGVANVGNFGSKDRVDYTALGESVNLASRMEGLNKYLGTECLISGTTAAEVRERLVLRKVGWFQLKGLENPVETYELVGFLEEAEESRTWREAFAEALQNYEQRNLELAALGFQNVLQIRPGDGPSRFYLERISELSSQPMPENWGTFTMKDK